MFHLQNTMRSDFYLPATIGLILGLAQHIAPPSFAFALRTRVQAADEAREAPEPCSVCLSQPPTRTTRCAHTVLCEDCFGRIRRERPAAEHRCPICRSSFWGVGARVVIGHFVRTGADGEEKTLVESPGRITATPEEGGHCFVVFNEREGGKGSRYYENAAAAMRVSRAGEYVRLA